MNANELRRGVRTRRDDADAWLALGNALAAEGDVARARAAYEHALTLDANRDDARRALATSEGPTAPLDQLLAWLDGPESSDEAGLSLDPPATDTRLVCTYCGAPNLPDRQTCVVCQEALRGTDVA